MERKIKIAIMSDTMDRRPQKAFAPKRLIENLLRNPELEISLVHYKKMPDEPLYRNEKIREIIIPLLSLPWASHFFSFIWFCLRTKEKFDIAHWLVPRPYPFFWLFPARKVVITAHDGYVGLWTFPNTMFWFFMRFFNRYIDGVIGVSEYAKQEIMDTYHFPESTVCVAYNGVDTVYKRISNGLASDILKKYNISTNNFFLYIGRQSLHKNVKRLIEAYISLRETYSTEQKLLLVGTSALRRENAEAIKDSKYYKDIICVGFVPIEDMPAFYSSAIALVFPSLQEGCGMPLIEAMACGTVVITSNVSAMPEIAGEAALLVDPYKSNEIMKGMRQVIKNESLRGDLVQKGYKRAASFTWERFARENLEVYNKVLGKK